MKLLPATLIAIAAPVAVEFLLGSTAEQLVNSRNAGVEDFGGLLLVFAIGGILALPVYSAICYGRLARPPAGAGWWIFVLNLFAVATAFFYSTRHIKIDL